MYNFFTDHGKTGGCYYIVGADYNHIKNVLRMREGDNFLVSCNGQSDLCELLSYGENFVEAGIITENYQNTELPVKIYLFEGLPKADKMELIIQKAVELGVYAIIPVEMEYSVVKLDDRKKSLRQQRWQIIAESAAKQSKRNCIPEVFNVMTYKQAVEAARQNDLFILPYENKQGMDSTAEALSKIRKGSSISVFIGPEGGFSEAEVNTALDAGASTVSLGKRILRTETAAITAVGMCMLYCELNGDKM